MHQVVTQYNRDTNALIRRRIRVGSGGGAAGGGPGGAGGLVQVRVPPAPLPLSWGRTVRPYDEEEQHPPCSGGVTHSKVHCVWETGIRVATGRPSHCSSHRTATRRATVREHWLYSAPQPPSPALMRSRPALLLLQSRPPAHLHPSHQRPRRRTPRPLPPLPAAPRAPPLPPPPLRLPSRWRGTTSRPRPPLRPSPLTS